MTDRRVKVLYVTSSARSGSTVLDNVLGNIEGFFSVGELRFLWERSLGENRVCGCGQPFSDCPVWSRVMEVAFGDPATIDPEQVVALRDAAMRLRSTPRALLPGGERTFRNRNEAYLAVLGRLYHAIAEVTGARVIVDSSKYPSYGYLLGLVPGLSVSVVHLVRDARAVAHSWTRHRLEPRAVGDLRPMGYVAPARTAVGWMMWALLAETYARTRPDRHLLVRYEDLAAHPLPVIRRIIQHLGEPVDRLPFVGPLHVDLGVNHTVGGNPSRFRTGTVELRADDEWTSAMRTRDKALVTALCWPLLQRYGYRGRLRGTERHGA